MNEKINIETGDDSTNITGKTVNVTNPRNVLVQIPSIIAGVEWGLKQGDELEVLYDDRTKEVTIRPHVQRRSGSCARC